MASGIKVKDECIEMWTWFHKGHLPPTMSPDQVKYIDSFLIPRRALPQEFQQQKECESSDDDTDSEWEDEFLTCEPQAIKKLRPRVMSLRVSKDCKTIELEKKKFFIPMKLKDGVADTERCTKKIINRLTKGSKASCKRPRWIIMYFDFLTEVDNRPTGKTIMIKWCPEQSTIKQKMYLSSSTKGLTDVLSDFKATAVQCDQPCDIQDIVTNLQKGILK